MSDGIEVRRYYERPILFSEPMVRAILDGRKAQTRRAAKLPDGNVGSMCPYGGVGDRLWVRESFAPVGGNGSPCAPRDAAFVVFRGGGQKYNDGTYYPPLPEYAEGAFDGIKWRPSIHLPRWASRITLEITDVRVERLQDISDADVAAEGIGVTHALDPQTAFRKLWDSINGRKAPWRASPWVWVISFRKAGAP